ncbi:NUDIX domain-containing protein [Promicromonospora soli]
MPRTARALKAEADDLRAKGWSWTQIARRWQRTQHLNPRVAFRFAHGLTQAAVAEEWNRRWPDEPKTAKHISYWETWPQPGGRTPSVDNLGRLAAIYQCSAGDLLGGDDHSHLDPATKSDLGIAEQGPQQGAQVLTVAISIVTNPADQILLVRPRAGGADSWQFPAGIVKPGADPAETAVNETLAETGIHCRPRQHLGRRIHPVTAALCEYFLCDHLAGAPVNADPDENAAVVWVERPHVTRFIPVGVIFPPILTALELET